MKKYYDFEGIYNAAANSDCANIVIAGPKSNGKTFGALRKGLKIYLGLDSERSKGRIIRYARRLKETVKKDNLLQLFRPHVKWIASVTDGRYTDYTMIGRRFYLCKRNESGKIIEKDLNPFCVVNALSTWETDSGADEGEAGIIIFDEAISRERQLPNEFNSLMKYRSNCMRDRTDYYCPVVLLGNTVTRDCTLLESFGIDLWKLDDNKKGYIQYIKNRKGKINCIFEWCGDVEIQSKTREYYDRFENSKTKMITDGVFEIGEYKTLPRLFVECKTRSLFKVCFIHKNFKLVADYRAYKTGDTFIYVCASESVDGCDMYINPYATTCNGIVLNYFDNNAAVIFRDLYLSNNVIFETEKTGEMYRSFAQVCIGLQSCVPD